MIQHTYSNDACKFAQEVILVSPESAFKRLSECIGSQLPRLNAPGIAVGLVHREHILHAGFYGLANRDTGERVTPETLFQIGSISKSFTSILLLQLQEQGLLDIHDPVETYLPWFKVQSEYEPITLRHLMSHSAGIICGSDATPAAHTEAWSLRFTKASAPPGEFFHYSNSGYKVLGLVAESVLGQSITDILRERILEPLGMQASLPEISSEARARLAVGYSPLYDDRPLPPGGPLAPATWLESNTADGSICSNAEDMCRYIQALLRHGHGLLSPESFEQLIAPVVPTDDGAHGEYYGLGLFTLNLDGRRVIGHSGGMVGFSADLLADLETGLGVIVLANGPAEPSRLSRYALRLLRAASAGDSLPDFPDEQVDYADDSTGVYRNGSKSFTLRADQHRLYLDFGPASVPLSPLGADRFIVPHPAFELFALSLERENGQVTAAGWGAERYVREGVAEGIQHTCPAEWGPYPGHYRSHNPWLSNFRVVWRKDTLIFIPPFGEEEPLHPLEPGLFRVGVDPRSPEFIRFELFIDGKAMQANLSGGDYSRTFTP